MKALCACLASVTLAFAWQPAPKPTFEVASIKPSDPNQSSSPLTGMSADRAIVRYSNISLRDCIRTAFRVRDFQVEGPDWLSKARFDITARLPQGTSPDDIPEMMQQLLTDRFKIELRRETRDQNVYAIVTGKTAPKLEPLDSKGAVNPITALGPDGRPRPLMMFRMSASSVTLTAPAATLAAVSEILSRFTSRPVVDMTGIDGRYRFSLTFAPETLPNMPGPPDPASEPSEPAPSLAEAFQQYGLRLESRRAPLEMLLVIHIEKTPTEN